MYDQLPYKRNADLCGEQNIAMYSGHIIKYYMCDNKEDSFEVDNHDGEIKTLLADIEANTSVTPTVEDISDNEDDMPEGISQKQVQTLLDDLQADIAASVFFFFIFPPPNRLSKRSGSRSLMSGSRLNRA